MGRSSERYQGDFTTGRITERDLFGEFKKSKTYIEEHRRLANQTGYIGYDHDMGLIRDNYIQEPTNPEKPFAKELRMAVIDDLGLNTNEEMSRVRFYTSVGTTLDYNHGVDGWFEFDLEKGGTRKITIDVTTNPNKDTWKANIIFQREDFPDPCDGEEEFLAVVAECKDLIMEELRPQKKRDPILLHKSAGRRLIIRT